MADVTSSFDVVVVGGGIAGLSVAASLAGKARVYLVEREPILAAQASGRNAAIYRPLEDDATTGVLARRTMDLLSSWSDAPVLSCCGVLLASAEPSRVIAEARRAQAQGVAHQILDRKAVTERVPLLAGGEIEGGLWLEQGGVLDIHAIAGALERRARAAGTVIRVGVSIDEIRVKQGRIVAVGLSDGSEVTCRHTVIAGGAWSSGLGARIGAPQPLLPVRRHLVQLAIPAGERVYLGPVVWRLEEEAYFRREGEGILASPCDQLPFAEDPPREPLADPAALEWLARRLRALAPQLDCAGAHSSWACFRTFAPDRELVAGSDPRVDGLHWLSGLGGRGMSVGVAAGELVAEGLLGRMSPLHQVFSPGRFLDLPL